MIFLSHTHKDKDLVSKVANVLSETFGQNNVFYDDWSIQPGDGIIKRMDEGLRNCKFFFFFVSKNSISSKMVELEWQNALFESTKGKIKLIPVKIDDCLMPQILLQTRYIDIFGQGLETGIRQIIDVIKGKSDTPEIQTYENIRGYIKNEEKSMIIEFRAESYLEPQSRYLILVSNLKEDLQIECLSDSMFMQGFNENLKISNGLETNAYGVSIHRGTSPGFPFVIKISSKEGKEIKINGLMRAVNQNEYKIIPVIKEK